MSTRPRTKSCYLDTYTKCPGKRSNGLTENDGHENDGPNLRVIKLQNLTTLNTLAIEIHAVTLKWHCFYVFVMFILCMHFVVV